MTTSLSGSVLITGEKTLSYTKSDSAVQLGGQQGRRSSFKDAVYELFGRFQYHLNMFKDKVQHVVASSESISADNAVVWS